MLFKLSVALLYASASAFPTTLGRHRALSVDPRAARIARLQAIDPTATSAACAACVGAEDDLIAAMGATEAAENDEVAKALAAVSAATEHGDATQVLSDNKAAASDAKAAVQAIVDGDQTDLGNDDPDGIIGSVDNLKAA